MRLHRREQILATTRAGLGCALGRPTSKKRRLPPPFRFLSQNHFHPSRVHTARWPCLGPRGVLSTRTKNGRVFSVYLASSSPLPCVLSASALLRDDDANAKPSQNEARFLTLLHFHGSGRGHSFRLFVGVCSEETRLQAVLGVYESPSADGRAPLPGSRTQDAGRQRNGAGPHRRQTPQSS